jgi:Lsr2
MARKVEVRLLDDLDDSQADETVQFGLDGTPYEIDLSSKHAKELRSMLDKYISVARRAGQSRRGTAGRKGARSAGTAVAHENQAIRQWAQSQGIAIALRGRIPQSIVEQYTSQSNATPAPSKRRKG